VISGRGERERAETTLNFIDANAYAGVPLKTEAEFLDLIGTNVLRVYFLLFTVASTNRFYFPHPPPPSKSGLKLVCNVNIVYGNL
jgi:hypothetical protein